MEPTEDIKLEDVHPEVVASVEEPKVLKKVQKLTEKLLNKVNGRINGERAIVRKKLDGGLKQIQSSIDKFTADTNTDLGKFKKHYEALYSDLVRRILIKMEGRVFSVELFNQATLDLCVEKLYRLEKNLDKDAELDHIDYQAYIEDCAALHEGFMQKHANAFADKQKEERDVAIQQEEESSTEDSGRAQDEGSDSDDSEDNRTVDSETSGHSE